MVIPKQTLLAHADSYKLYEAIRNSMGIEALPSIFENTENPTLTDLQRVGNIIVANNDYANNFLNTLINRIGMVVVMSRLYRNPWENFKSGYLELGDKIEDIWVKILEPRDFDPEKAQDELFKIKKPEVLSVVHSINYQKHYDVSISLQELRQAFLTTSGLYDLTNKIIEQLYTSANYDEFLSMKYLIASALINNVFYPVAIPQPTANTMREITAKMVAVSNDMQFMSSKYNAMGVENYSDKAKQYTILDTDFSALQSVEVLATSFNMDKAELQGRLKQVNSFSFDSTEKKRLVKLLGNYVNEVLTEENIVLLKSVHAVTVDEDFFRIFDNLFELRNAENGLGLYWNYFLHTWKILAYSPFMPAVAYTTSAGTIESVKVTPETANVRKGNTYQFKAEVDTLGFADSAVEWSIDSDISQITTTGLLIIAPSETASTIKVTATSVVDTEKKAVATVTVQNN